MCVKVCLGQLLKPGWIARRMGGESVLEGRTSWHSPCFPLAPLRCRPGRCARFQGISGALAWHAAHSHGPSKGAHSGWTSQTPSRHAWIHPATRIPTHPGDLSPTCAVMARARMCLTCVKSTSKLHGRRGGGAGSRCPCSVSSQK